MPAGPVVSHQQARAIYDRIGALQDSQRFYEDAAVRALIAHSDLSDARHIVEFGCGTGRHAERLLREVLPADARYVGIDVSSTMVQLARGRLQPWAERAVVWQTDGEPRIDAPDGSFDRFLSTYVFDLLSHDDIAHVLKEAHRVLQPGGRICLVSLTHGRTGFQRRVVGVLERIHAFRPSLIGGCRPVNLASALDELHWRLLYHRVISRFGIPSEIVVATPLQTATASASV